MFNKYHLKLAFYSSLVTIISVGILLLILDAHVSGAVHIRSDVSLVARMLGALIGAPLIETLLFQYAIILFLNKYRFSLFTCVLVSAFFFSASHAIVPSLSGGSLSAMVHMLMVAPGGIIYALLFSTILQRDNARTAFLTTALAHFLHNSYVTILVLTT